MCAFEIVYASRVPPRPVVRGLKKEANRNEVVGLPQASLLSDIFKCSTKTAFILVWQRTITRCNKDKLEPITMICEYTLHIQA